MKATLSFNLPEEQTEFELALAAGRYSDVIWGFAEKLRQRDKHDPDPTTTWADVRRLFWEQLDACGVELP